MDSPYSETSNTPKLFIYCTRAPCTAAGNSLKNTQKHRILNQNINIWNVEQRIITFTLLIVQFPKNNLVHIWCGGKKFRSMKYEMVNICPLKFVVRQAAFFLSPTPLLWLWLPLTTSSFLTSLPFAILAALYCSYRQASYLYHRVNAAFLVRPQIVRIIISREMRMDWNRKGGQVLQPIAGATAC